MIGFVYQLICPETREPLYVGSTVKFPNVRLSEHISWINRDTDIPLYKHLRENNIMPDIEVLEKVEFGGDIKDLRKEEDKWIGELLAKNIKLLNRANASYQTPKGDTIIEKQPKPKKEYAHVRMDIDVYNKVKKIYRYYSPINWRLLRLSSLRKITKTK